MRRWIVGFLMCCLVLSGQTVPPAEADSHAQLGDFMGMVVRDPFNEWHLNLADPAGANAAFFETLGAHLQYAGVRWVRFEFRAEDGTAYDPNHPGAGVRFAAYDYLINAVAPRYGFKIIAVLGTQLIKDPWFRDPELLEPAKVAGTSDGELAGRCWEYRYGCGTTKSMRILLDRAFAIAERYGPNIAAYEIMNEQNRYIHGDGRGVDPTALATLHTKFYRIFKQTGAPSSDAGMAAPWRDQQVPVWARDVAVLLGGMHAGRCDDCALGGFSDREYLAAVYQSAPMQGFRATYGRYPMDGVGYHPYPMEIYHNPRLPEPTGVDHVPLIADRITALWNVMQANGDHASQLWITEVGDRGDPHDPAAQERQAFFLRSVYWILWQQRAKIRMVLWFKYEDFAVAEGTENWGIVRLVRGTTTEYAPNGAVEIYKASFDAYRTIALGGLVTHELFVPLVIN